MIALLDQRIRQGKDVAAAVDQEAVANILAERTNMSQEEVQQTVELETTEAN